MKTAPKLKRFIEQIAHKHQFDLHQTEAYLRLNLNEDRLIIENIGASRISIAYQLFLLDAWIAEPEIVVWTAYAPVREAARERQWVPIELNLIKDGWKACAKIDQNGNLVAFYHHEWHAWLADFVETAVVPNLIRQGWLEQGIKSDEPPPTYTLEQKRERGYLMAEDVYPDAEVDDDVPF